MNTKKTYAAPLAEAIWLNTPLNLLDTLSTEGEIGDWTQENPIETTELE